MCLVMTVWQLWRRNKICNSKLGIQSKNVLKSNYKLFILITIHEIHSESDC